MNNRTLGKPTDLNSVSFRYFQTIGIVAIHANIVDYLISPASKDKEGLVRFDILSSLFEKKNFAWGYLYSQKFMLMAHPYFRRGYSQIANFSPRFIEMFWGANDTQIEFYIALDLDRVRINVDSLMYREFDTWYGASFDRDIKSIADGIVKLRPPLELTEFENSSFFANAYSLDIKWVTKNGIKSFQAEEFKNEGETLVIAGETCYPVRYIHAEFDIVQNCFRHFDGAVHFYTSDEYFARRDSDFNYNSKNKQHIKSDSKKLFKMNGHISVEVWIEFTCHFFTGNPLVFEYFEGKYPEHISEMLQLIKRIKK